MRKLGIIAVVIAIASLGVSAPARCLSITDLLSRIEGDQGFKLIQVSDLAAMLSKHDSRVMVYDANPPDVRETEGIIPGAHLLPTAGHYDVATELPPDRNTPLVFYCHNTL